MSNTAGKNSINVGASIPQSFSLCQWPFYYLICIIDISEIWKKLNIQLYVDNTILTSKYKDREAVRYPEEKKSDVCDSDTSTWVWH